MADNSFPKSLFGRVLNRGKRLSQRVRDRVQGGRLPDGTLVEVSFGEAGHGQAEVGWTLLQAAKELRVDVDHFCGGRCSCSTCRLVVPEASSAMLSRRDLNEETVLGPKAAARGDRLACQAKILGPVTVSIPATFNGI